jgi:two-component system, LytTR family, response regulator
MLQCIAVDDEPLALSLLIDYIDKISYLKLVAKCSDAFEAATALRENHIDLLFVDIQMPGLTGLQFIQSLTSRPMVIIVSAYKKFAHEGFELDVVDYLVKPVGLDRFMKACNKAMELYQLKNPAAGPASTAGGAAGGGGSAGAGAPSGIGGAGAGSAAVSGGGGALHVDYFFLNVDYSMVKVLFADITWIEGSGDYVKIHLKSAAKPLLVRMSARAMESELPADRFVRIHKSYIVAIQSITAVRRNSIFIGELELPVGETYREVTRQLTGKNL